MTALGALGGMTAAGWGWLLGISTPTFPGFLLPLAVGAVAGLLAGLGGAAVGRRSRAERRANRLVLVAKRKPSSGTQQLSGAVL